MGTEQPREGTSRGGWCIIVEASQPGPGEHSPERPTFDNEHLAMNHSGYLKAWEGEVRIRKEDSIGLGREIHQDLQEALFCSL